MCGLIATLGAYSNGFTNKDIEAWEHAIAVNAFRGHDSTGVFSVDAKGNTSVLKVMGHSFNLLSDKDWPEIRAKAIRSGRFFVGHGRKATQGDKSIVNAHPFVIREQDKKGKDTKHIILVHNGTLERWKNVGIEKFGVDSNWMAHEIAYKGPEAALANIHGAIATMWYDAVEKKFHVFRNKERPLWYFIDKQNNLFINSEPSVLWYQRIRFGLDSEMKVELFKEQTLYTFDLDYYSNDGLWEEKELPLPVFIQPKYEGRRSRSKWNSQTNAWDDDGLGHVDVKYPPHSNTGFLPHIVHGGRHTNYPLDMFKDDLERVAEGKIDYLEFKSGKMFVYHHPAFVGDTGRVSEFVREPPLYGLYEVHKENDYACRLFFQMAGTKWEEVRPTKRLILPNRPALTMTKKEIKEEVENYAIGTTPKPEGSSTWHSKCLLTIGDKEEAKVVRHFGFSEKNDPFRFSAYGNDIDGFFFVGQDIAMKIEYMRPASDNSSSPSLKYSGSLVPLNGTPGVLVNFYALKDAYRTEQTITGRVVLIQAARKEQYDEDGTSMIITIANQASAMGWETGKLDDLISYPRTIKTIGDAMKAERKCRAA